MELLNELYRISSPSGKEARMIKFITQRLRSMNVSFITDKIGNIFATKGQSASYPCVAAHIDEVHPRNKTPVDIINFRNEIIFGYDSKYKTFRGIGADDKNGIWICFKLLEKFPVLKCAFFTGEETGCIGSGHADLSFFDDCRFVLQCDRRGGSDLITSIENTKLCSPDFLREIGAGAFGYKATVGAMTDVYTLKRRGLGISCLNISCGYYNPHTSQEYTVIGELENCLNLVEHIIRACQKVYPHKYSPPVWRYDWGRDFNHGCYNTGRYSYNSLKNIDYDAMHSDMAQLMAADPFAALDDLEEMLADIYPTLGHDDFKKAYRELFLL